VNPLRHFFLVAVLLFAQLAAGAHAVDHAAGKEGALPGHACELCLAAHDLASALPSLAVPPPVAQPYLVPEVRPALGRTVFAAPLARQGAPPLS